LPALPPPYQHPLGIPLNGAKISPSEILFKSVHRENPPIRSYELPNATIRSYNGPYRHGESEYRLDFVFININIFSDRKKNDKDIERFFPLFYSGKTVRIRVGKATDGQNDFFFLVHLLKFESDTATLKDISIIRVNQNL